MQWDISQCGTLCLQAVFNGFLEQWELLIAGGKADVQLRWQDGVTESNPSVGGGSSPPSNDAALIYRSNMAAMRQGTPRQSNCAHQYSLKSTNTLVVAEGAGGGGSTCNIITSSVYHECFFVNQAANQINQSIMS